MFAKITRKNLGRFLSKYQTNKRVLDIGSGGSSYDSYFPNRLTVDIDPQREPDVVGDAHNLPFKDEEFEVLLCTEVLEHVKNPFEVENEFWRVLKPGGTLILSTRFVFPIHDAPHDYWRFTKYGLKNIFSRWQIVELSEEVGTIATLAVLLQRIGFQTTLRFNKLSKFLIFFAAKVLSRSGGLIRAEFGDIKKSVKEENIMSSGYYLVCKKQ